MHQTKDRVCQNHFAGEADTLILAKYQKAKNEISL